MPGAAEREGASHVQAYLIGYGPAVAGVGAAKLFLFELHGQQPLDGFSPTGFTQTICKTGVGDSGNDGDDGDYHHQFQQGNA